MSHQTGIQPNAALRLAFTKAQAANSDIRALKIIIDNEQLCLEHTDAIKGNMEQDWKRILPACLQDKEPCYVLIRFDSPTGTTSGGGKKDALVNNWCLLTYAPDAASIKRKMLIAATRATLKSEFGVAHVIEEMQANHKNETTINAWKDHLQSRTEMGPMSEVEAGLYAIHFHERDAQQRAQVANVAMSHTMRGLAFPVDQSAEEKLAELRDGKCNYVQLSVDTLNEAIKLEDCNTLRPNQLSTAIPKAAARYHFYRFVHTHEGEQYDSIIFIYSMPSRGCSIKEKMMYSSCKGPFLDSVQRFIGLVPAKKIEIDTADEVNESALIDIVHPRVALTPQMFAKPKPMGGPRPGARRQMVKPTASG